MRTSNDIARGRERKVALHGITEPHMKAGKGRGRALGYHELNRVGKVEVPQHVAIKRVPRLRKLKQCIDSKG